MNLVVTTAQMKEYEAYTMDGIGVPSLVLMERAALAVAEAIEASFEKEPREKRILKRVLVVCGSGNNGGDGAAVARLLFYKGYDVTAVFPMEESKATLPCQLQIKILHSIGVPVFHHIPEGEYDRIVDALFGIGLSRPVEGKIADIIIKINSLRKKRGLVISVDMPSGIHSDTGEVCGKAVKADKTITFAYQKMGSLLGEGPLYCGEVEVADVGIYAPHNFLKNIDFPVYTPEKSVLSLLPMRNPLGHKGSFGKVFCIVGSEDMPGAAILCGKAVLKSGAGMVKILTEPSVKDLLIQNLPEAMVSSCFPPEEKVLIDGITWGDCVVIGCGLSQSENAKKVMEIIMHYCDKKLLIDADGLNILSRQKEWLLKRKEKGYQTILTPHPGEFQRLFGEDMEALIDDNITSKVEKYIRIAQKYGVILVAKDAKTIVTDGKEAMINTSGSDAMATAGSGDVLSGMIGAFSCVCKDLFSAAKLAVYLHGLAGKAAGYKESNYSVTASDIIAGIGEVIKAEADHVWK